MCRRTVLAAALIRCYITDRRALGGSTEALLENVALQSRNGVDWIQIREKDLEARELAALVKAAVRAVRESTKIFVNGRVDVALAAGADGVHLPGDSVETPEWRRIVPAGFLIGVSCHSLLNLTAAQTADYAFFSPIFSTPGKGPAKGLDALREACQLSQIPVLALGGVTEDNAEHCVAAGATGVAAIRMFQPW